MEMNQPWFKVSHGELNLAVSGPSVTMMHDHFAFYNLMVIT